MDYPDLVAYIYGYYSSLYHQDEIMESSPEMIKTRAEVISVILQVVIDTQNDNFNWPLDAYKLEKVVKALESRKVPGPCGLPVEFFANL